MGHSDMETTADSDDEVIKSVNCELMVIKEREWNIKCDKCVVQLLKNGNDDSLYVQVMDVTEISRRKEAALVQRLEIQSMHNYQHKEHFASFSDDNNVTYGLNFPSIDDAQSFSNMLEDLGGIPRKEPIRMTPSLTSLQILSDGKKKSKCYHNKTLSERVLKLVAENERILASADCHFLWVHQSKWQENDNPIVVLILQCGDNFRIRLIETTEEETVVWKELFYSSKPEMERLKCNLLSFTSENYSFRLRFDSTAESKQFMSSLNGECSCITKTPKTESKTIEMTEEQEHLFNWLASKITVHDTNDEAFLKSLCIHNLPFVRLMIETDMKGEVLQPTVIWREEKKEEMVEEDGDLIIFSLVNDEEKEKMDDDKEEESEALSKVLDIELELVGTTRLEDSLNVDALSDTALLGDLSLETPVTSSQLSDMPNDLEAPPVPMQRTFSLMKKTKPKQLVEEDLAHVIDSDGTSSNSQKDTSAATQEKLQEPENLKNQTPDPTEGQATSMDTGEQASQKTIDVAVKNSNQPDPKQMKLMMGEMNKVVLKKTKSDHEKFEEKITETDKGAVNKSDTVPKALDIEPEPDDTTKVKDSKICTESNLVVTQNDLTPEVPVLQSPEMPDDIEMPPVPMQRTASLMKKPRTNKLEGNKTTVTDTNLKSNIVAPTSGSEELKNQQSGSSVTKVTQKNETKKQKTRNVNGEKDKNLATLKQRIQLRREKRKEKLKNSTQPLRKIRHRTHTRRTIRRKIRATWLILE